MVDGYRRDEGATRGRDVASNLADALESGAQKEVGRPPLQQAYGRAVAERDGTEQRQGGYMRKPSF